MNLNQNTENVDNDKLQEFINNASGSEPTRKIGGVKKGMILKDEKDKRTKSVTIYLTQDEYDYIKNISIFILFFSLNIFHNHANHYHCIL